MIDPLILLYETFLNGSAVSTDTRAIKPGCIFFALKGERFDGNDFALQALELGAAYVVCDRDSFKENSRLVFVPDALQCLQQLAQHHREQHNIPVLAVTGSNGKTTTKELLYRVLSEKYSTLCTTGNLNNHIGVPLTLLRLTSGHRMAVVEMGANHIGEIELLCSIARPTHVLITNVGKAHLEGFGGFEGVKKAKGEMYAFARGHNGMVFINTDNPQLVSMLGEYDHTCSYGTGADCEITGNVLADSNAHVAMEWKTATTETWHVVKSRMTGAYNFENILSAIAAGVHFGVAATDICHAIESYEPGNQRSQELHRGTNHIILDAYNANPTSMEAALDHFAKQYKGKRAVFLGDMLELGDAAHAEHDSVLRKAMTGGYDLVVLVGPQFAEVAQGSDSHMFADAQQAAEWVRRHPLSGYTILIKGSRGLKMETVLEGL